MDQQEITRRQVIQEVLSLEHSGCNLGEEAISHGQRVLYEQACAVFGTWTATLDYAAVRESRRSQSEASRDKVIRRIRRRCGCLSSLKATFVRKSDYRLYRNGVELFGSWENAVEAAGINVDKLYPGKGNPLLTKQQALAVLADRIATGGIPRLCVLACENQYLARFLIRQFKRFQHAISAAMQHTSGSHIGRGDADGTQPADSTA